MEQAIFRKGFVVRILRFGGTKEEGAGLCEVGHAAGQVEASGGALAMEADPGAEAGGAFTEFEDAGAAWADVVVDRITAAETSEHVEHVTVLHDIVVVVVMAAYHGFDIPHFLEVGYQTGIVV